MINQTIRRNRIVEVPEVHVIEKLVPKVTFQDVIRRVPKTEVQWVEKIVEVPQVKVKQTQQHASFTGKYHRTIFFSCECACCMLLVGASHS